MERWQSDPVVVVVGIVLVLLGATGATLAARRDGSGRTLPVVMAQLVPFGVLIGAGSSMVRGWHLGAAATAGAIVVPGVALVSRAIERRRGSSR